MNAPVRKFEFTEGGRVEVPLFIGLMAPSTGGKTFSALRLAKGIQSVVGGAIAVIDTESRRAKHYSDYFQFRHYDFTPPFGSLDYLAAVRQAVADGAKTVIIDSMSHEHNGEGGYLLTQEAELDRMAGDDWQKRERVKMAAWIKPTKLRSQMINGLLQLNANFIFCFRAKEKVKPVKVNGKTEIQEQGWMPIAGEEMIFEMTVNCLLTPKSNGVPSWRSDQVGERMMMKLPEQFRGVFTDGRQLDESVGRELAEWAKGDQSGQMERDAEACREVAKNGIEALQATWKSLGGARQKAIAHLLEDFKKQAQTQPPSPAPASEATPAPPAVEQTAAGVAPPTTDEVDEVWNDGFMCFGEGKGIMAYSPSLTTDEVKRWKAGWETAERQHKAARAAK